MNLTTNTGTTTPKINTSTVSQIELEADYIPTPPERTVELTKSTRVLLEEIEDELKANNGKLSSEFRLNYADSCQYEYGKIGRVRFCVLTTTNGSILTGKAIVLDPRNDIEEIGNKHAKKDAVSQIGSFLGGLAKMIKIGE
jgi:hypothetical protein